MPTAFTGTGAFTAQIGPSTRRPAGTHAQFPNASPQGKLCLSCHDGTKTAPQWLMGGTVYTDDTGTTAASSVEVRVLRPDGTALDAYTDQDGNFFVRPDGKNFPMSGGLAGVRNGASVQQMPTTPPNGDCNGCHGNGRVAKPLHL